MTNSEFAAVKKELQQSECGCQQSDENLEITVNSLKNQVAAIDDKVAAVKSDLLGLGNRYSRHPSK